MDTKYYTGPTSQDRWPTILLKQTKRFAQDITFHIKKPTNVNTNERCPDFHRLRFLKKCISAIFENKSHKEQFSNVIGLIAPHPEDASLNLSRILKQIKKTPWQPSMGVENPFNRLIVCVKMSPWRGVIPLITAQFHFWCHFKRMLAIATTLKEGFIIFDKAQKQNFVFGWIRACIERVVSRLRLTGTQKKPHW